MSASCFLDIKYSMGTILLFYVTEGGMIPLQAVPNAPYPHRFRAVTTYTDIDVEKGCHERLRNKRHTYFDYF